ncbi:MAG: hypothetical protein JXO72_08945 [Vicinamibacteria bacterium]|nr:hypothetical protein [Vicinamibacteria bacterium]
MQIGRDSGWTSRSGRSINVQFVDVSFRVRSAESVRLSHAYLYIYDADKRLIKGCQANKISRFYYNESLQSAGDAKGPRFEAGTYTIKFAWRDRGARFKYALCVLGAHESVVAAVASGEGPSPLDGFVFDEQDKLRN